MGMAYHLAIFSEERYGFIPFPRVIALCEIHTVSSRIWIRVVKFISYGNNRYVTIDPKIYINVRHEYTDVNMVVYIW